MTSHLKKVQKMLELRELKQDQQMKQLREIIHNSKTEFQELQSKFKEERSQLGIEIQGLVLEVKNLKTENLKLKGDGSNKNGPTPVKTLTITNARLLTVIGQLKMKNTELEEMVQQLFNYNPSEVVPVTPEKPIKTLSRKRKQLTIDVDVDETPRKSTRLMKNKKPKRHRVRKSGRKLTFKKK